MFTEAKICHITKSATILLRKFYSKKESHLFEYDISCLGIQKKDIKLFCISNFLHGFQNCIQWKVWRLQIEIFLPWFIQVKFHSVTIFHTFLWYQWKIIWLTTRFHITVTWRGKGQITATLFHQLQLLIFFPGVSH